LISFIISDGDDINLENTSIKSEDSHGNHSLIGLNTLFEAAQLEAQDQHDKGIPII